MGCNCNTPQLSDGTCKNLDSFVTKFRYPVIAGLVLLLLLKK